MTRLLFATAFLLGATAIVWTGLGFAGTHALAFVITLVIGGVYLIGIIELLKFGRATATLGVALRTIPEQTDPPAQWLETWLNRLDPSLRNAVSLRIEGERVGLPAPVFTPYLVGLLVMLGLLGTFVGMVDTLSGAVLALRGSTELDAIRAGLAAPIQGLGVAFGTSVAGVAASAMLGLISTLVRRDRMLATRVLESKIATVFRGFSLAHRRQQAFDALQVQTRALPEVTDKLQELATQLASMGDKLGESLLANQRQFQDSTDKRYAELGQMADSLGEALLSNQSQFQAATDKRYAQLETMGDKLAEALLSSQSQFQAATDQRYAQLESMGDKLGEALLANQRHFHEATGERYRELAASVGVSLQESLAASGRAAGESVTPVVAEAMAGISQMLQDTNTQLADTAASQLRAFGEEFRAASASLLSTFETTSSSWVEQSRELQGSVRESMTDSSREFADTARSTFASMLAEIGKLMQSTETLVQARMASEETWQDQQGDRLKQLTAVLTTELASLRSREEQGHAAAVSRLGELEANVAEHLTRLGQGLEEPMIRLIETASETPRAAAEVIGKLRAEISNNIERDNRLLEERQRVMDDLNKLSVSLAQTAASQRESVEKLVESSAGALQDISTRFGEHILAEIAKISEASTHVAGSATDLSSLGEAFGLAVEMFNTSNETMIEHLGRVEESMEKSSNRSDEQMAYYVAQAREIIDQSMLSQKEIVEELQRLSRNKQTAKQAKGQQRTPETEAS